MGLIGMGVNNSQFVRKDFFYWGHLFIFLFILLPIVIFALSNLFVGCASTGISKI